MKRIIPLFVVCALALPHAGWAMTPGEFDDRAIPLMAKPKEADKLLKICDEALADVRNDPEFEAFIHVMKSHALLMKKEYDKAEAEAKIVIASKRQEDLGHSALRDVLFARGRFDEGLEVCLQGVSRVPGEKNQELAKQDCQDMYLQVTSVTPETLWNAYKKNASAADGKYKGHTITVLGAVTRVEPRGDNAKVFFSLDKAGTKNVVCLFGDAASNAAASTPEAGKKAPDRGDGMAYSLGEDTSRPEGGKPSGSAKSDATGKKNSGSALQLPVSGDTVVVSGSVRGMEGNDLVLTNGVLLR